MGRSKYFHNNTQIRYVKEKMKKLKKGILTILNETCLSNSCDYWLSPKGEKCEKLSFLIETITSFSINYRDYGELL